MKFKTIPLLAHPLEAPAAFTPEALLEAVRAGRSLPFDPVPPVCVLDFDGDLTDWMVSAGAAKTWKSWACFHTTMHALEVDGTPCGIVPRTIGGPYAALIAEQLRASGAQVILGLTSAGRVAASVLVPSLVDKGSHEFSQRLLEAMCRAARSFLRGIQSRLDLRMCE